MTLTEHVAIGVLEGVALAADEMIDAPELKSESPVFRALAREARRAVFDLRGEAVARRSDAGIDRAGYVAPVTAALGVLRKACAVYDGAISRLASAAALVCVARRLEAIAPDLDDQPTLAHELGEQAARLRSQTEVWNCPQPSDDDEAPPVAVARLVDEITEIGWRAGIKH